MGGCGAGGGKRRNFKDAGRVCPVDYRLDPAIFAADPRLSCDALYVVGGLYGNPFALDALDALMAREADGALAVLNGDVHWFDKTAGNFLDIERRVEPYLPLVGNVEAELRRQVDVGVGCGCAYPDCTSDAAVSRSNRIHRTLSLAVHEQPACKKPLEGRPAALTVSVGGRKVGITHGDEKLIGGWGCSRESLQDVLRQDELSSWMRSMGIEVLATTHTCAPAAAVLEHGVVINNGAAGLPNFEGQLFGLVTRIATAPASEAVFSARKGPLFIEAVPLRYDHDAFLAWFDDLWPRLSPAAVSYRDRIAHGPDDRIDQALLGGFEVAPAFRDEASAYRRRAGHGDLAEAFAQLMYFEDLLDEECLKTVERPSTMQVNVGKRCNLACAHCHVEAGPHRTEAMGRECMEAVLKVMADHRMETLDITGGAPEMNPHFEWLIAKAAAQGLHVMVRSNLVILQEEGYRHLPELYARLGVEVVASLPNLNAGQAEQQRGGGTFDPTVALLRQLNDLGYGRDPRLVLDLVFNPQQPVLPPSQDALEALYRRRLEDHGIVFDKLFAITNNPIGRYGIHLLRTGEFDAYMDMLMDAFNEDAAWKMMCRGQVSVGWDGRIYDCDFNQVVDLAQPGENGDRTIFEYAADPSLPLARPILFGNHCYACAAGQGSSCGGTLVQGE